jgi:hypothetical protein
VGVCIDNCVRVEVYLAIHGIQFYTLGRNGDGSWGVSGQGNIRNTEPILRNFDRTERELQNLQAVNILYMIHCISAKVFSDKFKI